MRVLLFPLVFLFLVAPSFGDVSLNDDCSIHILNRTVQVNANGGWSLPNIPSNMGKVRARATCHVNGEVVTGQTDFFNVVNNGIFRTSQFQFAENTTTFSKLNFQLSGLTRIYGLGLTFDLVVIATYPDGREEDVSLEASGINYISSNPDVVSISPDGLLTAHAAGLVLITARLDGVLTVARIMVLTEGDTDNDGLSDDYEEEYGLDPNDPLDALEDRDKDGLTALQEFEAGTDPTMPDTDGDGISDGEELIEGKDGFITNPLLSDTDGDGLNDAAELLVGSSPTDGNDANFSDALLSISVLPETVSITFNDVDIEASQALTVIGELIDGSTTDLTSMLTGTSYHSNNTNVANFGIESGVIFGSSTGNAVITVTNGAFSVSLAVNVQTFQAKALSVLPISGGTHHLDVSGDYAYIASGASGLTIVDLSNREQPVVVSTFDTLGSVTDVRVVNGIAYLAAGTAGLLIVDVSTPSSPNLMGSFNASSAQSIEIYGELALITDGTSRVKMINLTDRWNPILLNTINTVGLSRALAISEDGRLLAVVTEKIELFNIADRDLPVSLSMVDTGTPRDVVFKGDVLLVGDYEQSLVSVDISDVNQPVVLDSTPLVNGGRLLGIAIHENFIFGADILFVNGIPIIDVSSPEALAPRMILDLREYGDDNGRGIAVDGAYIYLVTDRSRLFIAQYRVKEDKKGVSPTVSIIEPETGITAVSGGKINVKAVANDDIAVASVAFYADGQLLGSVGTLPYQFEVPVTGRFGVVNVGVKAFDLAGNASALIEINVLIEPDRDQDGLGDSAEITHYFTDPDNPDSDADGVLDGEEIARGIDPLRADTDRDGLSDNEEITLGVDGFLTNPRVADTDADGMSDSYESFRRGEPLLLDPTDPLDAAEDFDGDTLTALQEYEFGSDPSLVDTDGDGLGDALEYEFNTNPNLPNGLPIKVSSQIVSFINKHRQDQDNDGVSDYDEILIGTDPILEDSVLPSHALSAQITYLNQTIIDTDQDGISDKDEGLVGTNPQEASSTTPRYVGASLVAYLNKHIIDSDGDGATDRDERLIGTNPEQAGSVTPRYVKGALVAYLNKHIIDTDGDGATDRDERLIGTNPEQAGSVTPRYVKGALVTYLNRYIIDTDNDGVSDRDEVLTGTDKTKATSRIPAMAQSAFVAYLNQSSIVMTAAQRLEPMPKDATITADVRVALLAQLNSQQWQDMTPPILALITPELGINDIVPNSDITLTFSEPMDASTLDTNTLMLTANGETIGYQLTHSADHRVFILQAALSPMTQVEVIINGVKDMSGRGMTPMRSYFTIGSDLKGESPQVITQRPANGVVANESDLVLLGSLSFDKASVSDGLQVTVNGESVTGQLRLHDNGRIIEFTPDTPWPSNALIKVDLQAVKDTQGQAFYRYQGSFRTRGLGENESPYAVATNPPLGTQDVPTNVVIETAFSEPLNESTVNQDHVGMMQHDLDATLVSSTISLQRNDQVVRIQPQDTLPIGQQQMMAVTSGVNDKQLNSINDFTRDLMATSGLDETPPTLLYHLPNEQLAPNGYLMLAFSETMNPLSMTNQQIQWVDALGKDHAFNVSFSADHRSVRLLPSQALTAGSTYYLHLSGLEDLAGNLLSDMTLMFTVSESFDVIPPRAEVLNISRVLNNELEQTKIALSLDEALDPMSLGDAHIQLQAADMQVVSATMTWDQAGKILYLTVDGLLESGRLYHLDVGRAGLNDMAGNQLKGDLVLFAP